MALLCKFAFVINNYFLKFFKMCFFLIQSGCWVRGASRENPPQRQKLKMKLCFLSSGRRPVWDLSCVPEGTLYNIVIGWEHKAEGDIDQSYFDRRAKQLISRQSEEEGPGAWGHELVCPASKMEKLSSRLDSDTCLLTTEAAQLLGSPQLPRSL